MKHKHYDIAQNPTDNLWYVIGYCGGKKWMPVSSGFSTEAEAIAQAERQAKADRSARKELEGV